MKPQNALLSHLLLVGSAAALSVPNGAHTILARDGSNSSVPSNKSTISWAKCDLDFGETNNAIVDALPEKPECARLEVPLDYTSLSSGETIELQLLRFKANKEPYKGSILYNPGGPGGSGVERTAVGSVGGLLMRNITGGHYDIVTFDPRGVGRTIPFNCNMSSNVTAPTLHRRSPHTLAQADISQFIKPALWDPVGVLAEQCFKEQAKYGRFIGTPFVARDMISIADALDQGPKVNYWGTSYGTILGQVFASMFPDRVGRFLLDGNLLAEDYASTTWITGQRDTERALLRLFEECVEAGPEVCVLADFKGNGTTADDLMTALNAVLEETINAPNNTEGIGEVGVISFKAPLVQELYSPADYFKAIARVNYALTGNLTGATERAPDQLASEWNRGSEALWGVSCGDSSFRAENAEDLYSIYQSHLHQGSFADAMSSGRLQCTRWKFSAAEQIDLNKLRNVRTSFPVLVVNGHYDPVTPESTGFEVSARLRNSRMVVHMGAGHGFRNHPSSCTNEVVRQYFTDGKLPEVGTVCQPDKTGFEVAAEQQSK